MQAVKALVGVLPVVFILPTLINIIQKAVSGQPIDVASLLTQLLPVILISTLLPALFGE
jgi:hypothetical protein